MRKPLKVMQLVLSLVIGGTEKLVYDMVRHTDKQKVSPIICCLDGLGELGQDLQREGYPVYTLQRKPGLDWSIIPRLQAIVKQEQIDIIHAQQYTPYFYGIMTLLYNKLHLPTKSPGIIFTEHGIAYPYQKKIRRRLANPLLIRLADEVVTISEFTKNLLVDYENYPAHKINVLYNGIDLSQFSREIDKAAQKQSLGLPLDARIFGIVARLDPVKNHAMLLRAFQTTLSYIPDAYLAVVGDGPERKKLEAFAESLSIQGKTLFLGARKDIADLLHLFDVFVLPSFSEGMSVTLIEAMAAGVPIIATDVGGNSEVVKEQESGFLVESDNDRQLAEMLVKLLQNQELRQRMGRAGQQRAFDMFSLDKMIDRYLELYRKVSKI